MNIVLACAGEGRGHASRILALTHYLKDIYKIHFRCPETVAPVLSEAYPDIPLKTIPNIHYINDNFRIKYIETALSNLDHIINYQSTVELLMEDLKTINANAVVSDFEMYVSRAANQLNIPLLLLNHPGIVVKSWSLAPDALASKIVAAMMMPKADKRLLCSFYMGDVGPLIREEIRNLNPTKGDRYLVYTKPSFHTKLMEALSHIPDIAFDLFPDKSKNFAEHFASCKGVIAGAGHQMISESIYLGKPFFAIPAEGQYEQRLNAIMLERSGRGVYGKLFGLENQLRNFINTINDFPKPMRFMTPQDIKLEDDTPNVISQVREFIEGSMAIPELALHTKAAV